MSQRGHLLRVIPVRLVEFSWAGCLVESDEAIAPGTTGELRIEMDGHEHRDPLQIVRQIEQGGSSHPFTLGGKFVWGRHPDAASVRANVPSIVTIP